jgi:3-oxoadipate enol-lactonase
MSTTSLAYDAIEVLREVGYDAAHVHGLSLGGMVAQELAIRVPHRVLTLVLGATTAGGRAATPARRSTMWSSLSGTHSSVPGTESVNWRGALQQGMAASMHDTSARLSRIQAPTLVMHGDRDRLLPPENAEVLARLIPVRSFGSFPGPGTFTLSGRSKVIVVNSATSSATSRSHRCDGPAHNWCRYGMPARRSVTGLEGFATNF